MDGQDERDRGRKLTENTIDGHIVVRSKQYRKIQQFTGMLRSITGRIR